MADFSSFSDGNLNQALAMAGPTVPISALDIVSGDGCAKMTPNPRIAVASFDAYKTRGSHARPSVARKA